VPRELWDAPYRLLEGPNQWPDDTVPELGSLVEQWAGLLSTIGLELTRAIAVALALPEDHFDQYFAGQPHWFGKLIHYVGAADGTGWTRPSTQSHCRANTPSRPPASASPRITSCTAASATTRSRAGCAPTPRSRRPTTATCSSSRTRMTDHREADPFGTMPTPVLAAASTRSSHRDRVGH